MTKAKAKAQHERRIGQAHEENGAFSISPATGESVPGEKMELLPLIWRWDQPEKDREQYLTFSVLGFPLAKGTRKGTITKETDLPKRFVVLHGEALSNEVSLKLPCGQQWNIGLFKSHGKIYLQQGWAKFAQHYRLDRGHLLFFKYEGNSHFCVSICDITACEIDYPSIPAHSYVNLEAETEYNDSVLPPSSPSHRRTRTIDSKTKSQDPEEEIEAEGSKFKKSKNGGQGTYTSYRDSKAFKKASCFNSANPFFKKIVRDHSSANYNMRLPENFAKGHLERKTQIVNVQVGAKFWPVKLLNCTSGFFFSGGWSKYLSDNSLRPGDVCVYELIKRKPAVLKVTIFKLNAV